MCAKLRVKVDLHARVVHSIPDVLLHHNEDGCEMRGNIRNRAGLTRSAGLVLATTSLLAAPVVATAGGAPAKPAPVVPAEQHKALRVVDREALRKAPSISMSERQKALGHHKNASLKDVGGKKTTRTVAATPTMDVDAFRVMGVTWKGDRDDLAVFVRTKSADGWGEWEAIHADDSHGPDQESREGSRARGGTVPLIVDESTAVQVRVDDLPGGPSTAPEDLRLDLIDPKKVPADEDAGAAPASSLLPSVSAAAARPTILSRAQWGADESMRRDTPSYGTIRAGFVHHTVNSNGYTRSEVPALIRGIYRFHVKDRGWDDIGYNFIIDKYGRIWEGRAGGVTRPVIGAHTQGYNSSSFAASSLGDHTRTGPTTANLLAYKRLYAWKLGLHHVNPTVSTRLSNGSSTKWFKTISGHRDAGGTTCPGGAMYTKLPEIRSGAKYRQGAMFYSPYISKTKWAYGQPGPKIYAKANGYITYTWKVSHSCGGVVYSKTNNASVKYPITTMWGGKMYNGKWAPPGQYTITMTATDRTGKSKSVPAWSKKVTITSTPSSPSSLCYSSR